MSEEPAPLMSSMPPALLPPAPPPLLLPWVLFALLLLSWLLLLRRSLRATPSDELRRAAPAPRALWLPALLVVPGSRARLWRPTPSLAEFPPTLDEPRSGKSLGGVWERSRARESDSRRIPDTATDTPPVGIVAEATTPPPLPLPCPESSAGAAWMAALFDGRRRMEPGGRRRSPGSPDPPETNAGAASAEGPAGKGLAGPLVIRSATPELPTEPARERAGLSPLGPPMLRPDPVFRNSE